MPWSSLDPALIVGFLRQTAAATWVVDGDGYVLDVPEWSALTGQSAAEAEGDGWMDAIHPDDVDRVRAAWHTAVAHASLYNTDYRLRCADGAYRWFNARGVPVHGANGEVDKWVGAILSVPGQARAQRTGPGEMRPLAADRFDDISPTALRAARAVLEWPAERLAEKAGVARSTLRRLEDNEPSATPRRASIRKILRVLAAEQICCVGRDGRILGIIDRET